MSDHGNLDSTRKVTPRDLALHCVSGKCEGRKFQLPPGDPATIGRSPEQDLVLEGRQVSRAHARVTAVGDQVYIEDLGSSNGTFVNGQKIDKTWMDIGDCAVIGAFVLKLIAGEAPTLKLTSGELASLAADTATLDVVAGDAALMSGRIAEIPPPDLLQLFAATSKTGVLTLHCGTEVARITLRNGNITDCVLDRQFAHSPLKALCRLLLWRNGEFVLEPLPANAGEGRIDAPIQALIVEAFRQTDELEELRPALPPPEARLVAGKADVARLTPETRAVLELALRSGSIDATLTASPLTDLETGLQLRELLSSDHVRAVADKAG